ncbi:hypothetical protein BH09BAC5_BH09BAC5_04010 [soil metagenome]
MKNALFYTLFAGFISLNAYSEARKSIPAWYAGPSTKDSTLLKNQAAVEFIYTMNFDDDQNIPPIHSIIYSCNQKQDTFKMQSSGVEKLILKPGKYIFKFYVNEDFEEIKTDSIVFKNGYKTPLYLNFQSSKFPVICDKPVIYVYPQDTMQVNIQLDLKGVLGFTYPAYDIGWNFVADPDGKIHTNNKEYHYLFWDGTTNIDNSEINWYEGFIVEKDSLVPFFEEKLKLMGLNSKEIDDYITYWCPRMMVNEKNYIHFLFNDDYSEYAELNVNPVPDKMFRVFMLWTKADDERNTHVIPQEIEQFERVGFTIVEWGGAEMPKVPVIFDAQAAN